MRSRPVPRGPTSNVSCDPSLVEGNPSLVKGEPNAAALRGFDLGDLELALGTAGDLDGDHVAALVADEGLADRRLVGELALRGVGLGRTHDLELPRVARLLVLYVNPDSHAHRL